MNNLQPYEQAERVATRKAYDLSSAERQEILTSDATHIELARKFGLKPSAIANLRYYKKHRKGRVAKGDRVQRKQKQKQAKQEDGFSIKVGNINVNVISESQAKVAGLSVEEEQLTIKIA